VVNNSSSGSYSAKDVSEYIGPFVVNSITDSSGRSTLDIDVNNLVKPDGTKGSVPAGSYKIQFADSETGSTYVGTTQEPVTVKAPSENPATPNDPATPDDPAPENPSSGGSGCSAGYGFIGLLLMGFALRKYLTL
jgi:hypothetical protein